MRPVAYGSAAGSWGPSPYLHVDVHRVREMLRRPFDGDPNASEGRTLTTGWPSASTAPVPFVAAPADEAESSFGSWTGQSLLATLLGSPDGPEPNHHLCGSVGLPGPMALWSLDDFLTDPFPKATPIASARVEVVETAALSPAASAAAAAPRPRVILAVRYAEPLLAWAMLLVGIVGWSSAGPTYLLLPKRLQHRSLRISAWRYSGSFLPFALFTAWKWHRGGGTMRGEIARCLSSAPLWPQYLLLALSVFGGFVCYGLAVTYCDGLALAAGMSTINPFIQLLWDYSNGTPIGPHHRGALGLAALAVLTMLWADRLRSLHGIAWAVASAMCYVVYVDRSDALAHKVPFFLLMGITFGVGAIVSIAATFWFEGTTVRWGPESIFGFFESHHVFWVMLLVDVMFLLGICGLTGCLQHIPPLVVAVAIALEPVFAITMTVLGEEQRLPSPLMMSGVAALCVASVALGTLATLQGKEEVTVDITEAASWHR